jgi:hypothetical protein
MDGLQQRIPIAFAGHQWDLVDFALPYLREWSSEPIPPLSMPEWRGKTLWMPRDLFVFDQFLKLLSGIQAGGGVFEKSTVKHEDYIIQNVIVKLDNARRNL